MVIIDSHCHVSECWFEPAETLLYQMDRNGVERAVLIQMMGQTDNQYTFECARRFPGRFAVVVLVDTEKPDACQTLERLAEQGASGVRFYATTRSPGDDPLAIWRTAARLGLPVSCAGASTDFTSDAFLEVVQAVSELPIVIEHLGAGMDRAPVPLAVRQKVFALARFSNIYIKIHGLGEFAMRAMLVVEPFPFERPIPPLLQMVYQEFGPQRMMWGSDYPPVSAREGYRNALRLTIGEFAAKSDEERAQIFGRVALSVFPIR